MSPERLVDQRIAQVHVGEDAAAGPQVEAGLFNSACQAVAAAELHAQPRIEPFAMQLIDRGELHQADLEIVHAAVGGVLDVHIDVNTMDVKGGAYITAYIEEAFGQTCRVGSEPGPSHFLLRVAVRYGHVVINRIFLLLSRIQVERGSQAVVLMAGPGEKAGLLGVLHLIVVAVEIVLDVNHHLAGRPVVGDVAAHRVLHPGRLQHRGNVESASQVAEEGIVAAVEAGAEAVLGFRLEIDFAGRHHAPFSRSILRTESRIDIRRTIGPDRGELDRFIRSEVVQVAVRPVEDRIVEMDVEAMERVIDRSRDGGLADAVEVDVVGTAHLHRGYLGTERQDPAKQTQYKDGCSFHLLVVLSWFRRVRT